MRIIAGRHRGRRLTAPAGEATRPTADRVRQALFDMLWHAPWSPYASDRAAIDAVRVLDAFAGTGALGLEALSRGAAHATFLDTARPALAALRANIAACREEDRTTVLAADATKPPRAPAPCSLVFLDPPYAEGLLGRAVGALDTAGWIASGALVVAESAAAMDTPALPNGFDPLAERQHGPARISVFRAP